MAALKAKAPVIFVVVGCMGLGIKLGGSFWFRVVAKAGNFVVQFGRQV